MFKNYFLTIIRQILKNKVFSFINIFGLALGMGACLIIAQYVNFHTSFDSSVPNAERVYRIEANASRNGESLGQQLEIPSPLSDLLIGESPDVEQLTRFYNYTYANTSIIYNTEDLQVSFEQEGVHATEKDAFDIFGFDFVAGNGDKFGEPNKAVLTLSASRKYFDSPEKAIGTSFTLSGNDGSAEFELVGVLDDLPKNSHVDFELLISFSSIDRFTESRKNWVTTMLTYVKLSDPSKTEEVRSNVERIFEENAGELYAQSGYNMDFYLQPIQDIHLNTKSAGDFTAGIDSRIIFALSLIAIIILVIAWINYMNLSLVRTVERLKEMGIRKCLGSTVRQIILLFLLEAMVMNVIALALAIGGIQLSEKFLLELTGVPQAILMSGSAIYLQLLLVAMGTLIVGLYPYVLLKTMNIVNVLIGKQKRMSGSKVRKSLVFVQFAITFLLIAGTMTVYNQINYMREADLGIDIENVLVLKSPPSAVHPDERPEVSRFSTLKTELLKQTGVAEITNAGEIPGESVGWRTSFYLKNQSKESSVATGLISMDYDFPKFFGIDLISGRELQRGDDPWTKGDVVINAKLATMLGFSDPQDAVGAELDGFYGPILNVRGVLENHHHTSLHNDYEPIAYILSAWTEFYFIKLKLDETSAEGRSDQLAGLVQTVENEWGKVFTEYQMDYFFLDRSFDAQYKEDIRFGKIFSGFSALTILIACLGLFGLTSFTIQQRTKEIGIRKTLGATVNNLVMLLSKEYLVLVGTACLVSLPLAWWMMGKWLEEYTFRIDLGWWFFVVPILFVIVLALFSIISKILSTVKTNPIESLRYE
ncbi:MAG: FtsX-like permease family protein [Cyclobacteriaceae bacterium]